MAHPFEKLFTEALKKSSDIDNQVLEEAEDLIAKGYRREEVAQVLKGLAQGLIDTNERAIVAEAFTLVSEEGGE